MKLDALSLADVEEVRAWRNAALSSLRTPFLLTAEMQEDFYRNLTRYSRDRYWAIRVSGGLIGMAGLVGIEWENRLAEISLIISPDCRGAGYGKQAVDLLLHEGFNNMALENIYGECYECNPAIDFWRKLAAQYKAYMTTLPSRKYWNGSYWGSLYFNFRRQDC